MSSEPLNTAAAWRDELARSRAARKNIGVSPTSVLRERSGLDFLRAIASGEIPDPPICPVLNFWLLRVERGEALFQGEPSPEHYNPIGSVHGGWTATVLDSAMGCAVHTTLPAGQGYTTLELKVNLVRGLTHETGPLRAEGRIVSAGRTVGTAEGRLVGPDGKLYAHGTTTCLIFPL